LVRYLLSANLVASFDSLVVRELRKLLEQTRRLSVGQSDFEAHLAVIVGDVLD
jgi:hypothetical protein